MMQSNTIYDRKGNPYDIYRGGSLIFSANGLSLFVKLTDEPYIGFRDDVDIREGDILDNRNRQRFEVTDVSKNDGQLKVFYRQVPR